MTIRVLIFASLAQRLGEREMVVDLREGACVADLLDELSARRPELAAVRDRIATAVNMTYVKPDHALHDGDEVALIPPVSGG